MTRAEQQRSRRNRRRAAFFAGKCCAECGSTVDLEIDHVDPATKDPRLRRVTKIWDWSEARRIVELAKCQVLCSPCHLAKTTRERRAKPITHGRASSYTSRGCRCDLCKAAMRAYQREYETRRGLWS